MALNENPPEDPKGEFDKQADPYAPNENDPGRVFVGSDDEINEELARQRRQGAKIEAANKVDDDKKKEAQDAADKPKGDSDEMQTQPVSLWQRTADKYGLKLVDKGDYYRFRPDQRKLEDQIRAVILRAVYEKGLKNIHFYKGNQIDFGITSQASTILDKMKGQGLVPDDVNVVPARMQREEPWLTFVGRWSRDWRNKRYKKKNDTADRIKYGRGEGMMDGVRRAMTRGGRQNAERDMNRYGFNEKAAGQSKTPDVAMPDEVAPTEAAGEEEKVGTNGGGPSQPGAPAA